MSVLIKGLEMPETEYMDVRIFRDGTATIATGTKPYYRELKVEPVRHGKWIDGHCSICGCDVPAYIIDWKWQKDMNARFCPMCGARMESKGER